MYKDIHTKPAPLSPQGLFASRASQFVTESTRKCQICFRVYSYQKSKCRIFNYLRCRLKIIPNNFPVGCVSVLKNLLGRVGLCFLSCLLPRYTGLNSSGWITLCRSRTWHRAFKRRTTLSLYVAGCLGHIALWQTIWYGSFDHLIGGLSWITFESWTWSWSAFRLKARLICLWGVFVVRLARLGPYGTLGTSLCCLHFVLCNRQIFFHGRTCTDSFRLTAFSRLLLEHFCRTWCWPLWRLARRWFCSILGIRWTLFFKVGLEWDLFVDW